MSAIANLLSAERPPSKRWTICYLLATAFGFLLSSYATEVADKLAPRRPELVDGSMTAEDETGDVRVDHQGSDAPDLGESLDIERSLEHELGGPHINVDELERD